jgi:PilZ domain
MIIQPFDICRYVKPGDEATVGIRLMDQTFYEGSVLIKEVRGEDLVLELQGTLPDNAIASPDAKAMVTKKGNLALVRCHAVLCAPLVNGIVRCTVVDEVEIHQRREFFRLDVAIPIRWHVPEDQRLSAAIDYWSESRINVDIGPSPRLAQTADGGFRVLNWRGASLEPQRLNLSGGGIRCKLPQTLAIGTLVNLEMFLPLTPGRIIHSVGIVVRSSELTLAIDPAEAFLTGIRFVHLADSDRDTIIAYIFNEQRSQLRAYAEER